MKIYIPTLNGDINLTSSEAGKETIIETVKLSSPEEAILKELLKKFKAKFPKDNIFDNRKFTVGKTLDKVHKFLARKLKAGKDTITAVKLSDGKLEEVKDVEEAVKKAGEDAEAVTVEKPTRGCPMTIREERELHGSRVLRRFLNEDQLFDFQKYGAFITYGGHSGDRYRIAHRYSRANMKDNGMYFVKNLDTGKYLCNEPTPLPPSEEVLAIYVTISCREHEWVEKEHRTN